MPVREAVESMRADGTLPDPAIASALANGSTLAQALRRAPQLFPVEEVALVEAGEETGRLDAVLERIASIREEQQRAWQKLKSQLWYPLLIFHFAAVLMPFAILTVTSGRLRIAAGLTISMVILAVFWGGVVALLLAARDARTKARMLAVFEKIPALGAALRHQRAALFTTVLEASYESGVTLDRGLRLAAGTSGSAAAEAAADRVANGSPLAEALKAEPVLAAPLVGRLATAERAGALSDELRRISREEFEAADRTLGLAVGFLSKGFYVLMVIAVLVYALFMLSGVFSAYDKF
jgi:type II secretory pathway component PulF